MRNDLPQNKFKLALLGGQTQIGLWLSLTSPVSAEVVAGAGFDWVVIDMEHTALGLPDVAAMLRAVEGGTAEPMVRVPWNDPVVIKQVLDQGARTLLVPFVQTAAEAEQAVRAAHYPPRGIRGVAGVTRANRFGRVSEYFRRAAEEICVVVQVETRQAVAAIEDIAAVPGLDGIFVGPADLSADFGFPNEWQRPEIWSAVLDAGQRIRASGKAAGFLSGRREDCQGALEAGFNFVAVGSDIGIVARESEAVARSYKSSRPA